MRIVAIPRIAAIRNSSVIQMYKELFGIAAILANPLFLVKFEITIFLVCEERENNVSFSDFRQHSPEQ